MIFDNSKIRRKDRLLDEKRAMQLINESEYGVLVLTEGIQPYSVPVNYAFDGKENLYIHCAPDGKKMDIIKQNSNACFTIVGKTNPLPSKFTTEYESVILLGHAEIGLTDEEKILGHDIFIQKYCPNDLEMGRKYLTKSFHRMDMIRFRIEKISAKSKKIN